MWTTGSGARRSDAGVTDLAEAEYLKPNKKSKVKRSAAEASEDLGTTVVTAEAVRLVAARICD